MEMQAKDEQVQVFKELASASCVHILVSVHVHVCKLLAAKTRRMECTYT